MWVVNVIRYIGSTSEATEVFMFPFASFGIHETCRLQFEVCAVCTGTHADMVEDPR